RRQERRSRVKSPSRSPSPGALRPQPGGRPTGRRAVLHTPKRLFVGRPLRSDRLGETVLPKRLALPVFCSDPLSSVAYATEQIVLVLGLGGLSLLDLLPRLA